METETLIVEIPTQHAAELRDFAAARGGRAEPWKLALGQYGYLKLNRPYDNTSLCQAAAKALHTPEPQWERLSPTQQRELAELGVNDHSFMTEGRFEPESAEELRRILRKP